MAIGRYNRDAPLNATGLKPTHLSCAMLRDAIMNGAMPSSRVILKEGERLDILAGRYYGDGSLWWVIAAASGIGWGLQLPPGTVVNIPVDFAAIVMLFD